MLWIRPIQRFSNSSNYISNNHHIYSSKKYLVDKHNQITINALDSPTLSKKLYMDCHFTLSTCHILHDTPNIFIRSASFTIISQLKAEQCNDSSIKLNLLGTDSVAIESPIATNNLHQVELIFLHGIL